MSSTSEIGEDVSSPEIPVQRTPRIIKRKRAVKDPLAPTRPLSAYLVFLLEKQDDFRKADPERQMVDITRLVGAAWRNLSPEERKVYEADAERRKTRYFKEMAEYEKTESHKQFLARKQNPDSESPEEPRKKRQRSSRNAANDDLKSQGRSRKSAALTQTSALSQTRKKSTVEEHDEVSKNMSKIPENGFLSDFFALSELRVPIFNKEFLEWNTQREKELRQIRHQTHELEIDVAGFRTLENQERKTVENISLSRKKLAILGAKRKDVVKILLGEFSGVRLPSGLTITNDNVDEFMAEVEKTTSKSPTRHDDLMNRIRKLAPKLQPFMAHLQ